MDEHIFIATPCCLRPGSPCQLDYFPSTASIAAKPLLSGVRHLNLGAISRVDELPLFFDSA
jgi:hypothetical protein